MKIKYGMKTKRVYKYIDYPNLEEFNKETRFVRNKKEEISLH